MVSVSNLVVKLLLLRVAREVDLAIEMLLQAPQHRDQAGSGNGPDNHEIDITLCGFIIPRHDP